RLEPQVKTVCAERRSGARSSPEGRTKAGPESSRAEEGRQESRWQNTQEGNEESKESSPLERSGNACFTAAIGRQWNRRALSCKCCLVGSAVDRTDGPKVTRKMRRQQILIGHVAVALDAPAGAPRVADDEVPLTVVVADRDHAVTANHLLAVRRHRNDTGVGDLLAFKTLVHGEAEYEG